MQNNSNNFMMLIKLFGATKSSALALSLTFLTINVAGCSSKPKHDTTPSGPPSSEVFQPLSRAGDGSPLVVGATAEIQLQYLESVGVTDLQMHDVLSRNCTSCHNQSFAAMNLTILPHPDKYLLIQSRTAASSTSPMPPYGFANPADRDLIQNWITAQLNPAANSFEGYTVSAIDRSTFEVYAVEARTEGRFTVKLGDKTVASTTLLDLVVTGVDLVAQPIATIEVTIDRTGVFYRNVTVTSPHIEAPVVSPVVVVPPTCASITAAGGIANWRNQHAASLIDGSETEAAVAADVDLCFPTEVPKCVERIKGYAIKDDIADSEFDGSFATLAQKQPPEELRDPENASGYWIPDNIEEIAAQKGWTTVRYRSRHAGGFDSDTPNLMMVYVPGDKVTPPVKFDRWLNFPLPRDYDDSASLDSLDPTPTMGPPSRAAYLAPNNFPSTFTMVTQDLDNSLPLVSTRVYFQMFGRNDEGPTFMPRGIVDLAGCVSCHPSGLRAISPMGYSVRSGEKSLSKQNWDSVELINRKMIESANNLPPKWGDALVDGVSKPFYRADFMGPILGASKPANGFSRTKEFIMGGQIAGRQFSGCYKTQPSRNITDIFGRTPGMGPNNRAALSPEALLPQPLLTSVIDPQKVINAMNCEGCHVGGASAERKRWPLNTFNTQVAFKILVDQSMPMGAHTNAFNESHTLGQSTDALNSDERMALANCLEAELAEENTQENTLTWLKQESCPL